MSRARRPATRIDLGEKGRSALGTALRAILSELEIEVSDLKLAILVDHLEDRVGHLFYNRGVEDCAAAAETAVGRLQDDLDLLRRI